MHKMHDLMDGPRLSALESGPRRIRMITAAVLATLAWVMFFAALYLFWLTVT